MTEQELIAEIAAEINALPQTEDKNALVKLRALADEWSSLEADIEAAEARVSQLKKRRLEIQTKDMIDIMDEAPVDSFKAGDREYIAEIHYHAAIPEKNREEGIDWLEKNNAADLVNYDVITSFPKNSHEEAAALADYIRHRYQMATVDVKRAVPWARLTSWFKQVMTMEGSRPEIPMETLGAFAMRRVKIKLLAKAKRR